MKDLRPIQNTLVEGLGHWTFVFLFKSASNSADKDDMNIKNFLGISSHVTPASQVGKVDRQIKTDNTSDRDANGQQFYQQQKKKEKMTEEQFEKAIALLREKHFVKDMNWNVMACNEDGVKYAWVQDHSGKSIRKISEFDLWDIFEDIKSDETKGQLLKKTA